MNLARKSVRWKPLGQLRGLEPATRIYVALGAADGLYDGTRQTRYGSQERAPVFVSYFWKNQAENSPQGSNCIFVSCASLVEQQFYSPQNAGSGAG
jgi:hypothetical protein